MMFREERAAIKRLDYAIRCFGLLSWLSFGLSFVDFSEYGIENYWSNLISEYCVYACIGTGIISAVLFLYQQYKLETKMYTPLVALSCLSIPLTLLVFKFKVFQMLG